ncbi:tyrosine-type recombinase/integrase [Halobacterium jilantaiense]|uniref:Phage integrase family protein n=1 Tax=Halobacterium jilantaiense TaxID=355548 RepID=A0A1I0P7D1_9EURY|nr:site-specific integrase [Halobacterium jilantaiense]SEW09983.1 Phage integrase family protein [Halobacterium jilantaiense]
MNLREHDNKDGMKVWLSASEVDALLDAAKNTEHRIALALGARCGLRSHEVLDVAPEHVVDTDAGTMLRVYHGKGDQFRETPMPRDLRTTISTVADVRDEDDSTPLVATNQTRTLRRWIKRAAGELAADGDEAWRHLSFHDLRRTWATNLRNDDVDPLMACDWGGWNDLETFLEHYQGRFSPEAQKRERQKVDWL